MKDYFINRPFFYNPPWNILFELDRLNKLRPWDVNIAYLLTSFLKEMESLRSFDFRASGIALDSSATIFLMKTTLVLELQKPPPLPAVFKPESELSPLLLPARFELTSTTIQNLLEALEEVLKGEHFLKIKPREEYTLPLPLTSLLPLDAYLMKIEEMMENLHRKLISFLEKEKIVLFSKLVAGLDKLEAVKTFIILLFLAQKGKVDLWQDENLEEIYINPRV